MTRSKRKLEHIKHALKIGQSRMTGFDDIQFVHQSLPNCSISQIDLSTTVGELKLSSPFFINAMTGGGGEPTLRINQKLAIAARQTDLAIAVGSQMAAIKDPSEAKTFKIVRKEHPKGTIIANIGSEATVEVAKRVVDMIEADALQIHLNVIQELTMPEGDRNFIGNLSRIESIVNQVEVPIIVKEVGFGMSGETVSQLAGIGVSIIDIGGYGGTNFAKIENERRENTLSFFDEWGIPTAISIIEAKTTAPDMWVIGSGGIQSSLDMVKALSLGASSTALAGKFLKEVTEKSVEHLINEMETIKTEMKILMTALGAENIEQLQHCPLIISGNTYHWLNERGIETRKFSQRTKANKGCLS